MARPACAEAALLNGTTTIFCDSHEIENVLDAAGIEMMLEDARQAPLSIFLGPEHDPGDLAGARDRRRGLTAEKIGGLFDRWPEAVALGEKMDFVQVARGDERSHAILAAALQRGRAVSGHIYGREFVAAYAASGVTDTHEAIDREIADDLLEAGIWLFLRGGPPTTPWHSLPRAIKTVTELGASPKRLRLHRRPRCGRPAPVRARLGHARSDPRRDDPRAGLGMGSLHPATRYGMDGEIGGFGGGRRADIVLLDDDLKVRNTWYGGELVVEDRGIARSRRGALEPSATRARPMRPCGSRARRA